ncbi:MAG: hypothetical protein ROO76_22575 [Terriglobia bacterium]|nr:hypothetical protein [Terriglobia bacterium]
MNFLLGFAVVLLPERFRRQWLPQWHGNLLTSAVASGIAQMLSALGILAVRYPRFIQEQVAQIDARVVAGLAEKGGDTAVRAAGIILLVAYVLLPTSLLLIYFAFEGAVRLIAAISTREVVGTLPLALLDIASQKWSEYYAEKKQGPRVPDLVSEPPMNGSGYDLAIASCRSRPGWDHLMTISYNDKLYEVAEYIEGDEPRKHIYLLRLAPLQKVVRGLHQYDPEEVMKDKQLAISN